MEEKKINLTGKIIFITGGSSGLGYEMSKTLLSHGATVIIGSREGPKLDNVYNEFLSKGYNVHKVPIDITNEESIEKASKWFAVNFKNLDMLINNAGIGNNAPGMEDLPQDHKFYNIPISTVKTVLILIF
jgi:NAD(P)-dependent dehydrogenase (short-subunit alcohol dehydrogenase family)